MVTDPKATPFTFGAVSGTVAPPGIRILPVTVTFEVSLLVRVMNAPPAGAAVPSAIGKGTDCPGATVTFAGITIPLTLVSEKTAGVAIPAMDALTVYAPATALAVKFPDIATPNAFVVTEVTAPLAKLPAAPVVGAVNVTLIPLTGLPPKSFTVAVRGNTNVELMVPVWGVPPVAVTDAAGPAVLVIEKFAEDATPDTDAVTL